MNGGGWLLLLIVVLLVCLAIMFRLILLLLRGLRQKKDAQEGKGSPRDPAEDPWSEGGPGT